MMRFLGPKQAKDKELSLLSVSVCIKNPFGFFSQSATSVGPVYLRSFVPPQSSHPNITSTYPHLSARLSVCNGQDTEEGGRLRK